jgi:hypothetical protein
MTVRNTFSMVSVKRLGHRDESNVVRGLYFPLMLATKRRADCAKFVKLHAVVTGECMYHRRNTSKEVHARTRLAYLGIKVKE